MPSYELHGKGAIVTGGGRNIGRGIAHRLAAEGAAVAVADIDAAAGDAVAAEIQGVGGRAISVPTDVTHSSQVDLMVAQTVGEFGSLDVMVNNSGVLSTCPAIDITEDDWDRHFAVNTKGVLFCSQAAAHQMIDQGHGGRIITIVSTAGVLPSFRNTYVASYVASKHATMGLIRQMGQEIAPHGILMNAVFPGIVDTDMLRAMHRDVAADTGEVVACGWRHGGGPRLTEPEGSQRRSEVLALPQATADMDCEAPLDLRDLAVPDRSATAEPPLAGVHDSRVSAPEDASTEMS